jgi:hypothetical protein
MPDLTVIGGGPEKDDRERQRAREWAEDDFSLAIREVAANILRIIRGAGKPFELLLQMQKAIDAAVKFKEVHQHWPQEIITNDLQIQSEDERICREGKFPQATMTPKDFPRNHPFHSLPGTERLLARRDGI